MRTATDNPDHYVVVGSARTTNNNKRAMFVMRTDGSGNPIWTNTYGDDPSRDFGRELQIQKVDPSGYIVCGTVQQGATDRLGFLLRIDNAGGLVWMRFYSLGTGIQDIAFNDVQQTGTGYVVTGKAQPQLPAGQYPNLSDSIIMTTDNLGNPVWGKQYNNNEGMDWGESIVVLPAGFAVVGGHMPFTLDSWAGQLWVVNATGGMTWHRRIQHFTNGGSQIRNEVANGTIRVDTNGDLTVVGGGLTEAAMLRFTSTGTFAAGQTYGFVGPQYGTSFIAEPSGDLFVGFSVNLSPGDIDYYVVRTDTNWVSGCNEAAWSPSIDQPTIVPVDLMFDWTPSTVATARVPLHVILTWNQTTLCTSSTCFDPLVLTCIKSVTANDVTIEWGNLPGTADVLELLRNGVPIAFPTLADTFFVDPNPPVGTNFYELIASDSSMACETAHATCSIEIPLGTTLEQFTDVILFPLGLSTDESVVCLKDSLAALGREPLVISSFENISAQLGAAYPDVTPVAWISLGELPETYVLTEAEGQALTSFLAAGGALYIEGANVASDAPASLAAIDGVVALDDGASNGEVISLLGLNTGQGLDATTLSASYVGSGRSIDHLQAAGLGAAPIFENTGGEFQVTAIYYDAAPSGLGSHRVITSSTTLAGYAGDLSALLGEFLNALSPPAVSGTPFVRSDCNGDGNHDIADAIYKLSYLFAGGPAGPCLAACDANGDAMFDIADPVFTLSYLLLGGTEPPAPFPSCGVDAVGEAAFGCETGPSCP